MGTPTSGMSATLPGPGAAAGEDLALVTGRGQPDLTDLEGLGPYVRDEDLSVLGIRDDDEARDELAALKIQHDVVEDIRRNGAESGRNRSKPPTAAAARSRSAPAAALTSLRPNCCWPRSGAAP